MRLWLTLVNNVDSYKHTGSLTATYVYLHHSINNLSLEYATPDFDDANYLSYYDDYRDSFEELIMVPYV